jgi:intraflagellar transport protein 46
MSAAHGGANAGGADDDDRPLSDAMSNDGDGSEVSFGGSDADAATGTNEQSSPPAPAARPTAAGGAAGAGRAGGDAGLASFRLGGNAAPATDRLQNLPHDQAHAVEDAAHFATPRDATVGRAVASSATASATTAGPTGAAGVVKNQPFDAAYEVPDDDAKPKPGGKADALAQSKRGELKNQPSDVFVDVEDDDETPAASGGGASPGQSPSAAASRPGASALPGKNPVAGVPGIARPLQNNPNDAAIDVASSASGASPAASPGGSTAGSPSASMVARQQQPTPQAKPAAAAAAGASATAAAAAAGGARVTGSLAGRPAESDDDDDEDEEDELTDDEDGEGDGSDAHRGGASPGTAGAAGTGNTPAYNPDEYASILPQVSQEIKDLFGFITSFQPHQIECPTKLRPFVPDFIPCIGDIDAFCKIPPPDGKPDNLGLVVLDEPTCPQSNATVVKNAVRSSLKISMGPPVVDSVEEAHTRPAVLDRWIADVKNVRKPQTNVSYSKPMPDITQLLQEWPAEFEAALSSSDLALPPPNIDLDIFQYVKLLCSLVDIPTHTNQIESLHLMFSLYLDFRQNQHFQHS